jgi:ComEC/Rec2-related protein
MAGNFSASVGRVAGWAMLAFVGGVAVGSLGYQLHAGEGTSPLRLFWPVVFAVFSLALIVRRVPRSAKVIAVILFSFLIGLWRCEIAPAPQLRWIDGKAFVFNNSQPESAIGKKLEAWRGFVSARIASALPPDEANLVAGILYGDHNFSKQQREQFISSGLLHIVAVSGFNVTVIVQMVSAFFLGLGLRRRQAFYATTGAIFLFTGFVGFGASVMRAAFMGWLVLLAREVGRLVSPFRLLLVAAVILLLINPWQLAFDAGFALSFLAMWGLMAWSPLFENWLRRVPNILGVREIFSSSLAATLMTAPYLAWAFNRMSLAGLLTNVFALPLIPWIMGFGLLSAVWGNWPAFQFVSAPTLGLVRLVEMIAGSARWMPWLDLRIYGTSLSTLLATYALIVYLWRKLSGEKDLSTHSATRQRI